LETKESIGKKKPKKMGREGGIPITGSGKKEGQGLPHRRGWVRGWGTNFMTGMEGAGGRKEGEKYRKGEMGEGGMGGRERSGRVAIGV